MAEPRLDGPRHAARDRRRGAQPADAHQGVRQVRPIEETHFPADHERIMKKILVALLLLPICVWGQTYPSKPIRMVIPFAPGGASDFVGRILQPRMAELLGQQVVVENKPGASGNIGVAETARAAPDGYTIFLGNVGSVAINPGVFPNLPVLPTRDLI